SRTDPTLLNDYEMAAEGPGELPVPDLQTMEELCHPYLNGQGGPIASIAIQATNFGLKIDMIQQVQNSCQFHGLSGDVSNKHLDKFLHPPLETLRTYMMQEPIKGNNQGRNQFFHGANQGQNPPLAYQAPAYQALVYQALVYQPHIPQPQVVTTNKFTNFRKANDSILKNMQTSMTSLTNSNLELKNIFSHFMKMNIASYSGSGTLPGNRITYPEEDLKERETKETKDTVHPTNNRSTEDVQPLVVSTKCPILNSEPVVVPIIEPVASPFGPSIKSLLTNKDKLCELTGTPLNEHYLVVLQKKLPEKLGDSGKLHVSCYFLEMAECLALTDLGASINLMPLSVWNKLSLPNSSPPCTTLELTDHLISRQFEVAEDVFVKVSTFHFPADFIVVDFDADPRVPLILGRSFLKTRRALIDVFEVNYNDMTANRIDVIDMACEEYSQEVLSFYDVIASGNPTPYYDPIVSTTSSTLTLFRNSDFLLEEVDAFLALEYDPTSLEVDQSYVDTEGDILLLEAFLNEDLSLPPPNQGNYLPQVCKEQKIFEAKSNKSSIDKPPEVEHKDLPPYLEHAFMDGDDKLPVIIAKDLSVKEKTALITVLKSHKRAIAWKLSDIKGINPEFCTHKILTEEDFKPAVQHQRRVNPKIHDVIKQEVLKLLDVGLMIFDSPWIACLHRLSKVDEATDKDHFPLPFMDQMLERLERNQYYCYLDGFSRRHRVLCHLGLTFYYLRKRGRGSRNRGSLICSSISSGNTLQIFLRVSNGVTLEFPNPKMKRYSSS
nr:reverse transcriptase domain-containing protein [Tanacetum cinerariifolium]